MNNKNQNNQTILGLDLGSASIGWTLLNTNSDGIPNEVIDCGVRIFDSGREASKTGGLGDSKATSRRQARGIRRLLNRKRIRIKALCKLFDEYNISYFGNKEIISTNPYYLRDKALKEKLSSQELARVILHLGKHRGFKSNRKQGDSGGKLKKKFEELKNQLNNLTLGQYLYNSYISETTPNGNPNGAIRFKKGEDNDILPTRAMYMDEFNQIKSFQEPLHNLDEKFWKKAHDSIFYQRPLKSVEKGKCSYYLDKERAYKALPIFQKYRILDKLLNLTYINPNGEYLYVKDNLEYFNTLQKALNKKEKLTFDQIRKELNLDKGFKFRLEEGASQHIEGNKTNVEFNAFIPSFDNMDINQQTKITKALLNCSFLEDLENEKDINWQELLAPNKTLEELFEIIKLEDDIASFSEEFLNDLTKIMEEQTLPSYSAITQLSYNGEKLIWGKQNHHDGSMDKLPYYGKILTTRVAQKKPKNKIDLLQEENAKIEAEYGKIGNPSVHVNLNQLQKLVNAIIDKYGKPTYISIESSRELLGSKKYQETIDSQNNNNKENDRLKQLLTEHNMKINQKDLLKLKLWEELGENEKAKCPYCNNVSIGWENLFSDNKVEIEHIIPRSQSFDDNFNNLTLACSNCNRNKGNRTPYEFNPNLDLAYINSNEAISKTKKWRFGKEARDIFERALNEKLSKEEEKKYGIKNGSWLSRQMNDLSYTNRVAKEYLSCVVDYHKIFPAKGAFVQQIKRTLNFASPIKNELNEIIDENQYVKLPFNQKYFETKQGKKNRTHHYHHIIDSFVVALVNKKFYDKFNRDISKFYQEYKDKKDIELAKNDYINREICQNIGQLKKQLEQKLSKVVVSYKPEHNTNSRFLKEKALGKISTNDTTRSDSHLKNATPYEFVVNQPLSSFKSADIENIRDKKLRENIRNYIFSSGNIFTGLASDKADKKVQELLKPYGKEHNIKSIRVLTTGGGAKHITHTRKEDGKELEKYYINDGYAFVDIFEHTQYALDKNGNKIVKKDKQSGKDSKIWIGYFVESVDAMAEEMEINKIKANQKADPNYLINNVYKKQYEDSTGFKWDMTSKKIVRLYKKDLIRLTCNKNSPHWDDFFKLFATNMTELNNDNYEVILRIGQTDKSLHRVLTYPYFNSKTEKGIILGIGTSLPKFNLQKIYVDELGKIKTPRRLIIK